jgi:glycerol 2-dehydrogenase (NADP+)
VSSFLLFSALLVPTLRVGKCKSIGVSNFGVPLLEQLFKETKVVPATNQVELHPFLPLNDLQGLCAAKGIVLTAYSPLGTSSSYARSVED